MSEEKSVKKERRRTVQGFLGNRREKKLIKRIRAGMLQRHEPKEEKDLMTGSCECCGQRVFVARIGTEKELDELATEICSCKGAKLKRKLKEHDARVREYVEIEFEGDINRMNVMLDAMEGVRGGSLDQVSIDIGKTRYVVRYKEERGNTIKKTTKWESEEQF